MEIKSLLLVIPLTLLGYSVINAAESQWYWISTPGDSMKGYFIEQPLVKTIGYTDDSEQIATQTVIRDSFMSVMDLATSSTRCSNKLTDAVSKLREFDATHEFYIPVNCGPYGCKGDAFNRQVNQDTITARQNLLIGIEEDAKKCLDAENNAIQKAAEERRLLEMQERRIEDVKEAVKNCDFDYFEKEMTNKERMETYHERIACKESIPITKPESSVPPVSETQVSLQSMAPIIKSKVPETIITKKDEVETSFVTSTVTSTDEVVQSTSGTQENYTEHVDEKSDNRELEPDPKIERNSFFKRVVNFLFGWWR